MVKRIPNLVRWPCLTNRFSRVCSCGFDLEILFLDSRALDQVIAFELFSQPSAESTGVAFPGLLGSGPPLGDFVSLLDT